MMLNNFRKHAYDMLCNAKGPHKYYLTILAKIHHNSYQGA